MSENVKLPRDVAEFVNALRTAFVGGCRWSASYGNPLPNLLSDRMALYKGWSRDAFPLTRTVPRVRVDEYDIEWRFDGDEFHRRDAGRKTWQTGEGSTVTPNRVRLWADLLANPTTTVTE